MVVPFDNSAAAQLFASSFLMPVPEQFLSIVTVV
jgi:hypothetical protein